MIDRRELVSALVGCFLALPLTCRSQQPARVFRLGILWPAVASLDMGTEITLALRQLGYVEGRNLIVENRYAEGQLERLPGLARELTQLRTDVIFAIGIAATRAAKEATASVPIIMLVDGDPVAMGLVSSLARPEGNVTGVVLSTGTLTGKRLELLKEAIPGAVRLHSSLPIIRASSVKWRKRIRPLHPLRLTYAWSQFTQETTTARSQRLPRRARRHCASEPAVSSFGTARGSSRLPPSIGCPQSTNCQCKRRPADSWPTDRTSGPSPNWR